MPLFSANIAVTFAADLVHKSVFKQEVFASKKPHSYWWKKAPHQPITKWYGKPRDLVAEEQGEVVGGMAEQK